eukprot:3285451-Prymnesium_polylepis.1
MPRTRVTFLPRRGPPGPPDPPRAARPRTLPRNQPRSHTEHGLARVTPPHSTAPTYISTRAHTHSRAHTP